MIKRLSLGCAMLLLAAAAPAPAVPTGPVAMLARPGTPLDQTARRVAAADVADGGPGALVLLGSQRLGTAGVGPALFVQIQSPRACGSAGCSTSIYLPTRTGWTKVLDAVSTTIVVQPTVHAGMHDLLINRGDRWVWNGRVYADTLPAPQVNLHPRRHPAPHHPTPEKHPPAGH